MRATFNVKDDRYEVTLEKRERGEEDKFNPFAGTVSGPTGGGVQGTFQITDEALKRADERASSSGVTSDELLARACGKSAATELVIRQLKPEFSFVVDHRFVEVVS